MSASKGFRRFEAGARCAASLAWLALAALSLYQAVVFGRAGHPVLAWMHLGMAAVLGPWAATSAFNWWLAWVEAGRAPLPGEPGAFWTGQVQVEGDQLVARVSLRALPRILEGAAGPSGWGPDEPEVVDLQRLGERVALELGTYPIALDAEYRTLFQRALDAALLGVVESGDDCVRLPGDPEPSDG